MDSNLLSHSSDYSVSGLYRALCSHRLSVPTSLAQRQQWTTQHCPRQRLNSGSRRVLLVRLFLNTTKIATKASVSTVTFRLFELVRQQETQRQCYYQISIQVLSVGQDKLRAVPLGNADWTFVYTEAYVIQRDPTVKKTIWRTEISRGNASNSIPLRPYPLPPPSTNIPARSNAVLMSQNSRTV